MPASSESSGYKNRGQVLFDGFLIKCDTFFYDAFIYALDVEQAQLIDTIVVADYINIADRQGTFLSPKKTSKETSVLFSQESFSIQSFFSAVWKAILKYLLEQTEVIV